MEMPTFEVIFDGEVLGQAEALNLPKLIDDLKLRACWGTSVQDRCPTGGYLHAHIGADLFDPTPETRGDRSYFTATLPRVGTVSYSFDPTHAIPPPVTFREMAA